MTYNRSEKERKNTYQGLNASGVEERQKVSKKEKKNSSFQALQ